MPSKLPSNATVRDVLNTLGNADRFVSSVYGVMHRATKVHGPVVMRLGITGIGRIPNYRLEQVSSGEPVVALDGATHEPWPDGVDFTGMDNWSSATMSTVQVRDLLGEIRQCRLP